MKYLALNYTGEVFLQSFNVGDDFQTLAVSRLLPRVDGYVSREYLNDDTLSGIIPLNGFFLNTGNWPPTSGLCPIFFSFHVTPVAEKFICAPAGIAYLKAHEPIGCRDKGTMNLLAKHNVKAYYSKCLTLTFDRRNEPVSDGRVYIVSVSKACQSIIPRIMRKKAIWVDQSKVRLPAVPPHIRLQLAEHLLETYKQTASLIITSKIHCALPCIAMGIPVIFLFDHEQRDNYRIQIINDLVGINYVRSSWLDRMVLNLFRSRKINWNPDPIDIEDEKQEIKNQFMEALHLAESRYKSKYPN
jgi:hypothetical protein